MSEKCRKNSNVFTRFLPDFKQRKRGRTHSCVKVVKAKNTKSLTCMRVRTREQGKAMGIIQGKTFVAPLGFHGIRTNTRMKTKGMFFVIPPFHLLHHSFANSTQHNKPYKKKIMHFFSVYSLFPLFSTPLCIGEGSKRVSLLGLITGCATNRASPSKAFTAQPQKIPPAGNPTEGRCLKRDSNSYSHNGQGILSPSCLPFHHSGVRWCKGKDFKKNGQMFLLVLYDKNV